MFPSLPCFCCTPKAGKLLCFPVTCIMEVMASSEGGRGREGDGSFLIPLAAARLLLVHHAASIPTLKMF